VAKTETKETRPAMPATGRKGAEGFVQRFTLKPPCPTCGCCVREHAVVETSAVRVPDKPPSVAPGLDGELPTCSRCGKLLEPGDGDGKCLACYIEAMQALEG
jgi:hypothetical protein